MYGLALLYREMTSFQRIQWNLRRSLDAPNFLNIMNNIIVNEQIPQPISDSPIDKYQQKEKLVYCPNCHYEVMTGIPGPKCAICHSYLIVTPK